MTVSAGAILTKLALIARVNNEDHELGTMDVEFPVHLSKDNPLAIEVGDIRPALANALREAAVALDADVRGDAS